jgi:hypothetical protein
MGSRAYRQKWQLTRHGSLASSTTNRSYSSPPWCPYTDFVTLHRTSIQKQGKLEWVNLPESYAFGCGSLFKSIHIHPWFQAIKISRTDLTKYTRLRTGHSLLPYHSFNMGLNSSAFCSQLQRGLL